MQNRPDIGELLEALGEFLQNDARPVLKAQDAGLGFRALIAGHMCQLLRAELAFEETQDQAEIEGLTELLPAHSALRDKAERKRSERKEALSTLNQALTEELRAGGVAEDRRQAIHRHLEQTLRNRLMTINPRFDSTSDIP